MDEISTEFEDKADELRSLLFSFDKIAVSNRLEEFVENADEEEYVGVCYYLGVSILSVIEMAPEMGFVEFRIAGSEDTSLPMAFYLNTFLNSFIWQNPQLAVATADTISQHTKRTQLFFIWKLLLISQSLSDMLVTSLTEEVK